MPWRRGLVDRIAGLLRTRERRFASFHVERLAQLTAQHDRTVELFCVRIQQLEAELAQAHSLNEELRQRLLEYQQGRGAPLP